MTPINWTFTKQTTHFINIAFRNMIILKKRRTRTCTPFLYVGQSKNINKRNKNRVFQNRYVAYLNGLSRGVGALATALKKSNNSRDVASELKEKTDSDFFSYRLGHVVGTRKTLSVAGERCNNDSDLNRIWFCAFVESFQPMTTAVKKVTNFFGGASCPSIQ